MEMSQTLEDQNQGQSSGMEWGVRSPRNANTSLAVAWERVERRGVERAKCLCQLKGAKKPNCLDRFNSMLEAEGSRAPSFADADSKL